MSGCPIYSVSLGLNVPFQCLSSPSCGCAVPWRGQFKFIETTTASCISLILELHWRCIVYSCYMLLLAFWREAVFPSAYWSNLLPIFSPPARWGLLDFMSVASSSSSSSSSSSFSSLFSSSFSSSSSPLFSSPLLVSSPRLLSSCSLPDFNHDHPRPVCPAGPQPRPSTPSVPCRTSTTTIHAQCSLPDLNHDHPRPVFPAGPQPRGSMPSVPCRTSCRKIWDKECAEES